MSLCGNFVELVEKFKLLDDDDFVKLKDTDIENEQFKVEHIEVYIEKLIIPELEEKPLTIVDVAVGEVKAEQVEELLRGITTVEEIAEVERAINEAKGKVLVEPALGFWEGKTPCWEMFRCPEAMKSECPAFKYRTLPCWQIEGTYCKLLDYGQRGDGTDICQVCRVYKRWGHGEPIELKLYGKGFNAAGKAVPK